MGKVTVIVGAQYGSEGKGNISSFLADRYQVHVRTGGPNAGHTFKHGGDVFKQQVLPVGWTNPDSHVIVGRGALVNMEILVSEVAHAMEHDETVPARVWIDSDAGVLDKRFAEMEGGTEGELHERIGSTGKGVGAARRARIDRDPKTFRHMGDDSARKDLRALCEEAGVPDLTVRFTNTPRVIEMLRERGLNVLLEGTQGAGLSLIHGPWPKVTSADTNAAAFASEAGVPPHAVTDVILVARTYPIRVGGNSGPLKNEISWSDIADRTGKPVEEVRERTTVTNKIRRVAKWDETLVRRAVTLNDPTFFALNFIDYLSPEDEGKRDFDALSEDAKSFIDYLETTFDTPVALVGTGGEDDWYVIDRGMEVA